jgi:O-antigen ligase
MSTYSSHFDGAMPTRPRALRRVGETIFGRVTIWLVLAMAIGAWIAMSDGLTRPYIPDSEFLPNAQILAYEAYKAAWVFAAVAFPLILLHGARLKFTLTESTLLWFMLCTAAYAKDFAYIKVPGAPIYITDIVLALALASTFLWPRLRSPRLKSGLMKALLVFLILGAIAAARGVAMWMAFVDVLRDFSIVVYASFMLLGMFARRRKEFTEQFCLMLICGAVISTLVGVSWYFAEPDMRRYINYFYVPLAFVLVMVGVLNRRLKLTVGIPLLMVLGWGLIVSNTRSTYVALAATIGFMVLAGFGHLRWKDIVKPLLVPVVVMVIAVGSMLQSREGARYVDRINEQIVSLVAHTGDDDNAQWRLVAWAEALHRFAINPVMGEGFGVPLTFEGSDSDSKPHNIYITILYKMGVLGAAAFSLVLLVPVFAAWRVTRRHAGHPNALLLRALFFCQVFGLCFGAVNPVIESPFLACVFWLNLGLMYRMARQIRGDSEPGPLASAAA